MQTQITTPGPLLNDRGELTQPGWAITPQQTYNPEAVSLYPLKALNRLRLKEWDYYGLTTPEYFLALCVSNIGYAGLAFAYYIDFASGEITERTVVTPLGRGCTLPHSSMQGDIHFSGSGVTMSFGHLNLSRRLRVRWPDFRNGETLQADLLLQQPKDLDSITMSTPIGKKRFYYNHKINCMPASGTITLGNIRHDVAPDSAMGSLDWGRGIWEYKSFWNWASASGFLPDGRSIGLNLGKGFGDLSHATENAVYIDGRMHKLDDLDLRYTSGSYMEPWTMTTSEGRLNLRFEPFFERIATTKLVLLSTEVHQMFGRYSGNFTLDNGEVLPIENLIGWAEEHHARW